MELVNKVLQGYVDGELKDIAPSTRQDNVFLSTNQEKTIEDGLVSVYTHTRSGTVNEFTGTGPNGRVLMTSDIEVGDTFTVNGQPVAAYVGSENAIDVIVGSPWNGKWISFTFDGTQINFKGGGGLSAADKAKLIPENIKAGVTFFEGTPKEVTGTLKKEERPVEYSFFNVQSHRYGGHSGTSNPENWNNTVIPGTYRAVYQTSILYRGFDAYFNINGSRAVNGRNYNFPDGRCNVSGGRGSNTHDDVEGACAMASLRLIKID